MLFDPEIDSIEDVLLIRAKAIELLKQGATVMNWTNEGTSVSKAFGLPLRDVLAETKKFLQVADPDTYGRRITRTIPFYR